MEDKIFDIITDLLRKDIEKEDAISEILKLHNDKLSAFQKNRLDILNWAKSELKQATNKKLDKTMTSYLSDRIAFLKRIISWIEG